MGIEAFLKTAATTSPQHFQIPLYLFFPASGLSLDVSLAAKVMFP